jgi:hypothetical protein
MGDISVSLCTDKMKENGYNYDFQLHPRRKTAPAVLRARV